MAKKEICGWQNTDLTTLTRWHRDTGVKVTLTATGSNDMTDLERYEQDQMRAIGKDCVNA